jgi:hypothetical protein
MGENTPGDVPVYLTFAQYLLDALSVEKTWALACNFHSATLLSHRFEQHNCYRGRKVQAPCPAHRDRDAIVDVGREQTLRQPLGFTTENEKITWPKRHIVVSALAFRSQKKTTCIRGLGALQVTEGIPESHIHFVPVIKTGAFQVPIVKRKPEWLYQVQRRFGRHTKPSNVAGVRWNLRFNQNDVEHGEISQEPRKARRRISSEFSRVCFS